MRIILFLCVQCFYVRSVFFTLRCQINAPQLPPPAPSPRLLFLENLNPPPQPATNLD